MARIQRPYALAEEVRRHAPNPVSAAVLAEHFGVSRRTIERDLVALRDAGVPLYAITGRGGGQSLVAGAGRAPLTLSVAEAAALLLAGHVTTGMPYGGAAQAATRRLLDVLPAAAHIEVDDLARRIRTSAVAAPPDRWPGCSTSSRRPCGLAAWCASATSTARPEQHPDRGGGRLPRRRRRLGPHRLVPAATWRPGVPPRPHPARLANRRASAAPRRRCHPRLGAEHAYHSRLSPDRAQLPEKRRWIRRVRRTATPGLPRHALRHPQVSSVPSGRVKWRVPSGLRVTEKPRSWMAWWW
ncbi:MAG: helix-turn-helix domain-containing protein [Acidimicrobiia bacterium]|nr:helix-turn-helix domain-containing protein [Acidimicrobiia bacterium]